MKKLFKFIASVMLVCMAGCDTVDFTDDFDNATLLPPYVAFDQGQLTSQGWVYTATQNERGSFRSVVTPALTGTPAPTNLTGLRVRLPEAIEETVDVQYRVTGTAQYGRDFRLFAMNAAGAWVETPLSGQDGLVQILYFVENPTPIEIAPHSRDLRVAIQPGSAVNVNLRIELLSATSPSGREIVIGRYPDIRDRVVTLQITPRP